MVAQEATGQLEAEAQEPEIQVEQMVPDPQKLEQEASGGIAYMDPKLRVIDYIRNTAEYVRTKDGLVSASAMLDRFLFPPEEQYGLIEKLSGGEKRLVDCSKVSAGDET